MLLEAHLLSKTLATLITLVVPPFKEYAVDANSEAVFPLKSS